jgi:hypothetical protein
MGNASKLTSIQKRKRLSALFERGGYVRFNSNGVLPPDAEETDEDVKVWVGPPSPFQREMAIREAQAARSRAMLEARNKEDSSQYVNARAFLSGLTNEDLADYVIDLDEAERMSRARRQVLMKKEWEDFNSLRDAMRQFEEAGSPQDDPDWALLMKRDQEFGEQVLAEAQVLRDGDRQGYALMPREPLEKKALEKRIDQAASAVFMKNYEDWMLYYACRDDEDHSVLFFEDVNDLKSMPDEVQTALSESLALYINEAAEAKNSPRAASGSASSEPPVEPETSEASGPQESSE